MKRLTFTANGQPKTKGSMRAIFRGGRRFVVEDNDRTKPWMQTVSYAAKARGCKPIPAEQGAAISLLFRLPRPASHLLASGEASARASPLPVRHGTGDLDKLLRAVFDALNRIAWDDDSQVVEIVARKVWATDDDPPGVSVTVELAEVG